MRRDALAILLCLAASVGASRDCRAAECPGKETDATATEEMAVEGPTVYVRAATGPRPNEAVCLVCRYGARPVVMVCVRGLDDDVAELIERIDRSVDKHRADGLRGMAIFLDKDARLAQPLVAMMAWKRQLTLPLVFPVEAGGPKALELSPDAQLTVLLYKERKVQQRLVFSAGELKEKGSDGVLAAVEKLIAPQ